jgi:hypothetical protein
MEDPRLVFLGEEFRAVEDTHTNVDSVLVHNRVSGEDCNVTLQKRCKVRTSNLMEGCQLAAMAVRLVLQSSAKVLP